MKKKIGTMDIILAVVGVFLLLFTLEMIHTFHLYGAVPDTLVTCVFAAIASECGIMGWIKNTKERARDRQWMKEDQKQEENKNGNHN